MSAPGTATPLARQVAERIREQGPISFAEFMRECLYHPEWGYYNRAEPRRSVDFYTSVDVHAIFGRLLARQLAEMWDLLGRPSAFWAVEAGAGTGRLAAQVLDFAARDLGEFYDALHYVAVEQSAARRSGHPRVLASHLSRARLSSAAAFPAAIPAGCVFSNELLDALPVHRVVMDRGLLREIYVDLDGEELVESPGPLSTPELETYFRVQDVTLREGQQAEAGLEACGWIVDAGERLGRGFVLTVDYGHEARELYNERHMRGTLLAYSGHRATEEFLRAPGEQDLTAHVNFTALDLWGCRAGLARIGCVTQTQFLAAMGRANEFADLYEPGSSEVQRIRARLRLKTLIHPEGMGETFHVLGQQKGEPAAQLTGFCA